MTRSDNPPARYVRLPSAVLASLNACAFGAGSVLFGHEFHRGVISWGLVVTVVLSSMCCVVLLAGARVR